MHKISPAEKYEIIRQVLAKETSVITIADSHQIPVRTLQRWVKQYQDTNAEGLKKRTRIDKGTRRVISEKYVELVKALSLHRPRLPIAMIHRKLDSLAQREGIESPSYSTVYQIVQSLAPALLTLAHEGVKVYSQKYESLFRWESLASNELWQVDHTLLDIFLLNEQGQPQRPWLTIVIDDYSRAICGCFLSFEAPSAIHTALALRDAIWRKSDPRWPMCGTPKIMYVDHGSDFISEHIRQVCMSLSIRITHSQVGRPQGRGKVERFFETLNQGFLLALPGYSEANKPSTPPQLTLKIFEEELLTFVVDTYHRKIHSTTGITPYDRWLANAFLPDLPPSLELLDLLLLTIVKPRKVRREGIYFQGLRYMTATLAAFVGESVTIRYDPRDVAEIKVYHQDQFLCRAFCQQIDSQVVSLKEIIQTRQRARKELQKQIQVSQQLLNQTEWPDSAFISAAPAIPIKNSAPISEAVALKLYKND